VTTLTAAHLVKRQRRGLRYGREYHRGNSNEANSTVTLIALCTFVAIARGLAPGRPRGSGRFRFMFRFTCRYG
jgi:hypothetical protein